MARHGENIYKRKDGRYEGRYVKGKKPDGKTLFGYVYGKRYQEVRRQLLMFKAKQLANSSIIPCHLTLNEWMERWLENEKRSKVKVSSYQTYLRSFRTHVQPELGRMKLSAIDRACLHAFVLNLQRCGRSINTIKAVFRLLSSAMKRAEEEGLIQKNPCSMLTLPRSSQPEQRVLSRHEQLLLSGAAAASSDLASILGLYTGMRLGEICALKWEDIDLEHRTICIRRTAQRVASVMNGGSRTQLVIGTPKSLRAIRRIPIPAFIAQMLITRRGTAQSEYVVGKSTLPVDPRTIQRRFKKMICRLELGNVHFHTLRHTFATRMLDLGVDVKTVSTLLGHSSPQITLNFYGHSLWEQQCSAMSRLENMKY